MPRLRTKALSKTNIELFLNDLFLRDGLYRSVSVDELDVYSNNLSLLVPSESIEPDLAFPDNKVFQSPFKNWVYEEGIPGSSGVPAPTIISGVLVDGTFYPTNSGDPGYSAAFAHQPDFPNGRVIFDSPVTAGSVVKAAYSYKEVGVSFANIFNNEVSPVLIETAMKDNPEATGVDRYPSEESVTLPGVFIDFLSRDSKGYELGDKSLIAEYFGVFHIWARDDYIKDIVEDILADEQRTVVIGINFNTAPFPLLGFGEKNPNFPEYRSLANVHSPHFWRRIYLDVVSTRKDNPLFEVERSRVEFTARVYPNF